MHVLKTKEQNGPPTFIDVHSKASSCDARGIAGPLSIFPRSITVEW